LYVSVCVLPGVRHAGDVHSETVWAGQSAEEVQVDGAEGSNRPVRTTTEDQLVCDRQTGGLGRLRTDRQVNRQTDRQTDGLGRPVLVSLLQH